MQKLLQSLVLTAMDINPENETSYNTKHPEACPNDVEN